MTHTRIALIVALAAIALAGCKSTSPASEWQPHQSLVTVLAEMELHLHDDFYRFGYPRDVTDQNVFKASLVRIANWETQWPDRWPDIVANAKALAFGALGEFETSAQLFREVEESDSRLAEVADENLTVMERLADLDAFEPEGNTLSLFLLDMESHVEDWRRQAVGLRGTQWEAVAAVAWEQAEMNWVETLAQVRFNLSDGESRYRSACEDLIEHHSESHRINQHWLRLGDYHRELAQRLVVMSPPQQTVFDLDTFEELVGAARAIYIRVERADGFRERLEARAHLAGLEEFASRVREEAR